MSSSFVVGGGVAIALDIKITPMPLLVPPEWNPF